MLIMPHLFSRVVRVFLFSGLVVLGTPPTVFTLTGWVEVPLPITSQNLTTISFANVNHGCLCGSSGGLVGPTIVFLHTSDHGATWRPDTIPFPPEVNRLGGCKQVDDSVAWAWGYGNLESRQWSVVRTTDAGRTWAFRNPPESLYVLGVSFSSSNRAWAVTSTRIWTTSNAGEVWEPRGVVNPLGYDVSWFPHALEFQGDSVGYLGGSWGLVQDDLLPMVTRDGGWTWEHAWFLRANGPFGRGEPVRFLHDTIQTFRKSWRVDEISTDQRTAIILTWNGMRDSSAFTWFSRPGESPPAGVALDSSNFWILRDFRPFGPSQVHRTTDGGTTWTVDTLPVFLVDLLVDKYGNRFALGADRLFEFTGPLDVGPSPNDLPMVTKLHQNYPNPFNPLTTITYEVPVAGHVKLSVFDVLGREVALVTDGMVSAGTHHARVDGSSLTTGVYYYRLSTNAGSFTKKLIIQK